MQSVVSICNAALTDLGANPITSLYPAAGEDATTEQKLAQAHYEPSRDAVLEAGDWTFATKQRILAASTEEAPFDDATLFQVPSDCIRIIRCSRTSFDNNELTWRVQDGFIYAVAGNVYLTYVYRLEDPVQFSPLFAEAVAARMAWRMAIPVTQSRTLRNENFDLFVQALERARANDGMQGKMQEVRVTRLRRARYGHSHMSMPYDYRSA